MKPSKLISWLDQAVVRAAYAIVSALFFEASVACAQSSPPDDVAQSAEKVFVGVPHTRVWEVTDDFSDLKRFRFFYSRTSIGVPKSLRMEVYLWKEIDSAAIGVLSKGDVNGFNEFLRLLLINHDGGFSDLEEDEMKSLCLLFARSIFSSNYSLVFDDDIRAKGKKENHGLMFKLNNLDDSRATISYLVKDRAGRISLIDLLVQSSGKCLSFRESLFDEKTESNRDGN